jgi:hypothetical protein
MGTGFTQMVSNVYLGEARTLPTALNLKRGSTKTRSDKSEFSSHLDGT